MSNDGRPPLPFAQLRPLLILGITVAAVWWQVSQPAPQQPAPQNGGPVTTSESAPESPWKDTERGAEPPAPSVAPGDATLPDESEPTSAEVTSDRPANSLPNSKHNSEPKAKRQGNSKFVVENQTIRDLSGRVAFRGTVDLTPTIERIQRGESNRHKNDGTTFQNREGRLPRKTGGYYKEYVHPTPGVNGPGPQRLIFGKEGEIWYTPDHYETFQEIRGKSK